jgi:predicted branched-subunit amino acid permease
MSTELPAVERAAPGTTGAHEAAEDTVVLGARESLPLGIALAAVGIAFGYTAHVAGLTWWLAGLMSATTYGGPSQFLAAGLIGTGAAIPAIVATVFVANLRYSLFAATLAPSLRDSPRRRLFLLAYGLADGSYALTLQHAGEKRRRRVDRYLLGSIMVSFPVWVAATIVGNLAGAELPAVLAYGLGFATPAIFIAFLMSAVRDHIGIVVMLMAGLGSVVAHDNLPTGAGPVVSIGVAAVVGGVLRCRQQER